MLDFSSRQSFKYVLFFAVVFLVSIVNDGGAIFWSIRVNFQNFYCMSIKIFMSPNLGSVVLFQI